MASKQLRSFAIEYEVNYELELLDDLSPRPAGLLDFPPSDVGESWEPPLIRLLGRVATRSKWHLKERQNHDQTTSVICLGQIKGQVARGHERSILVCFNFFFLDKLAHNSGTRRAYSAAQKRIR